MANLHGHSTRPGATLWEDLQEKIAHAIMLLMLRLVVKRREVPYRLK